jgi:fanconi anemia group M protein
MSSHFSRNTHSIASNFSSSSSSRANSSHESDALLTWIYPTNEEVRQYQRSICETALFNNTLVCLPTGLGKTFIASVVMFNYYRWFPEGKIVFMAPTRPLVMQQIEACYRVVGIPESDTAHLEGSVAPERRAFLWEKHRVFFCTPQVFANDIAAGRCDAARVVFICFDEAHKATKNFAYTQVMKEISNFNDNFRVLALTATPGADAPAIQSVIRNLNITKIESRSEDDPEVISHTHAKQIEIVKCKLGAESAIASIKTKLIDLVKPSCLVLLQHNFLVSDVFENLNFLILDEAYK